MIDVNQKLKVILENEAFALIKDDLKMHFGFANNQFINLTLTDLVKHSNNTWDAKQMQLGLEHFIDYSQNNNSVILFSNFKVISLIPKDATDFVIICPGGGYQEVATIVEGFPVARALNQQNIAVFILIYGTNDEALFPQPIKQLATLVKYIHTNPLYLKLNISNYAIIGFSSGGHLVSNFALKQNGFLKYAVAKPAAIILGYSVISLLNDVHLRSQKMVLGTQKSDRSWQVKYSAEQNLDNEYPKTYIWTLKDDCAVNSQNSLNFARALKKHNVEHKFLIYPGTKHGLGLARGNIAEGWLDDAVDFWLN